MKNQVKEKEENSTVIVYTYCYYYKLRNGKLCVKYVTGSLAEHDEFQKQLKESDNILSALYEYVNEINYAFLGYTKVVKEEEKKDGEKSEKN